MGNSNSSDNKTTTLTEKKEVKPEITKPTEIRNIEEATNWVLRNKNEQQYKYHWDTQESRECELEEWELTLKKDKTCIYKDYGEVCKIIGQPETQHERNGTGTWTIDIKCNVTITINGLEYKGSGRGKDEILQNYGTPMNGYVRTFCKSDFEKLNVTKRG